MRVLRGRAETRDSDREVTAGMLETAGEHGEPALRVWTPHRQVAFGRRERNEPGYEAAREAARERGFAPVERSVGGRAVAYTGSTLAFALALPIENVREGLDERYEHATDRVQSALREVGVPAERGEPPDSFCPGRHSLSYRGKLVGIAQRVRSDSALVSGIVVVDGHEEIARVLEPVYAALEAPFDPDSVGSVERAGGEADSRVVAREIESWLVDDREARIERVDRKP
jgi:octanoyl-[GcvH]:protein N-octanoyltransferase